MTTDGVKSTVCYKVEDYDLCLRNPHDFKKRNFGVSLRTFPGDPSAIESALSDSAVPAILIMDWQLLRWPHETNWGLGCRISDVGCQMTDVESRMSDVKSGMSDVRWLALKPDWHLYSKLWLVRKAMKCLQTCFSRSLEMTGRTDIGL